MAVGKGTLPRVVLVKRATRLDELIARYNTLDQARFILESQGRDFGDYLDEHRRYYEQLVIAREEIKQTALLQEVDRRYLPNFVFGPSDVIVAVGQDGLVANVLKYLDQQVLIGVNPDPGRWDGVLLSFLPEDLSGLLPEVFAQRHRIREVTMAEASLNDGQTLHAVNDLFIGPKSHTSARYQIAHRGRNERHSSSGVIVSTGLGSTGWFQSLMVGAVSIDARREGRESMTDAKDFSFDWSERRLAFTVREPFPSRTTGATLVHDWIRESEELRLVSEMAENGVIFSDGIESDFLSFNAGAVAEIRISRRRGRLVVG